MLEVGALLDGKYRIARLLGEGGMGSVYEGTNVLIERRVAIKVLHRSATARDPRVIQRFSREARAAGLIGNDHILEILDLGVLPSGESYLVMEFLDGEPLSERLRTRGTLAEGELVPILEQTLDGLRAAHRAGIVHRDLKPDNLFLVREKANVRDFVKIIDFGISKFSELDGEMRMTKTGALLGTPYYMSPEQARGADQVTARSDLYSLGVIAYEALTGKRPYDGGTVNELLFKIVLSDAPSLSTLSPSLDRGLVAIVEQAMARDPGARFESADAFLAALSAYRKGTSKTLDIGTPDPLIDHDASRPIGGSIDPRRAATREFAAVDDSVNAPLALPLERSRGPWIAAALLGAAAIVAVALLGGADADAPPAAEGPSSAGPPEVPSSGSTSPAPKPEAPAKTAEASAEPASAPPTLLRPEAPPPPAPRPAPETRPRPAASSVLAPRSSRERPPAVAAAPAAPSEPPAPLPAPKPRPRVTPDFGY